MPPQSTRETQAVRRPSLHRPRRVVALAQFITMVMFTIACTSSGSGTPLDDAGEGIEIDAPRSCDIAGCVGDGINTSDGAYQFSTADLLFPSGLFAVQLTRVYRSSRATVGWFGQGWATVYDTTLARHDGVWTLDAPAGFYPLWSTEAPAGWTVTGQPLISVGDGGAELTWPTGERWHFDATGALVMLTSPYGQSVEIDRVDGLPTSIVSSQGPRLEFTSENGRITTATVDDGRQVSYTYANSELVAVNAPGLRESFRYNSDGLLLERSTPIGTTHVGYEAGRAADQSLPSGEHITIAYDQRATTVVGTTTMRFLHDDAGRLIHASTGDLTVAERQFDDQGFLVEAIDYVQPGDQVLHHLRRVYDERGNVVQEIENGTSTDIDYDTLGRVTRIQREGEATTFEYVDGTPLPAAVTSPGRGRDELQYRDGFVSQVIDATGAQTTITRDALGNPTSRSTASGSEWSYTFDAEGNITSTTSPSRRVWTAEWTARSQLVAERDPLGRVTSYTYDNAGRLVVEVLPGGDTRRRSYNDAGLLVEETDASGQATRYEYDSNRHISTMVEPGERSWRTTTRDESQGGATVTVTAPDGTYTVSRMDSIGREIDRRSYEADGSLVEQRLRTFEFDRSRIVTTIRGSSRLESTSTYDSLGRLVGTVDTLDGHPLSSTSYTFENGRLAAAASGSDEVRYSYDAAGRIVEVRTGDDRWTGTYRAGQLVATAHNGATTAIRYDADGRADAFDDESGTTTQWAFDDGDRPVARSVGSTIARFDWSVADQLLAYHSPDGGRWAYEYDDGGRLVRSEEPGDITTTYEYGLDGVTRIESSGAGHDRDDRFEYDANGRLQQAKTGQGTFNYSYDATGRVVAINAENWTYDAAGRLSAVTSGSNAYELAYDQAGHLVTITDGDHSLHATWTSGGLSGVDVSNRDSLHIGTDADGRLVSVSWDDDTAVDISWSGQSFTVQQRGAEAGQSYEVSDGVLTGYSSDGLRIDSHQQQSGYLAALNLATDRDGAGTITFDALGRPATLVANDSTSTITYDTQGRASSVLTSRPGEAPEQTTVTYGEDGRGIEGDKHLVERLFAEDGSLRTPLPSSLGNPVSATNDSSDLAAASLSVGAQILVAPEPRPLDEISAAVVAATPDVITPVGVKDLGNLAEQMIVAEVSRLAPRFRVNGAVTVTVPVIDPGTGGAADFNPYLDASPSGLVLGLLAEESGGGGSLLSRAIDTVTDIVGGVVEFVRDTVEFIIGNPLARLVLSAGTFALAIAACSPQAVAACLPVASIAVTLMAGDAAITVSSSVPAAVQSCSKAELIQCGLALAETAIAVGVAATAVHLGNSIFGVLRARQALAWAVRSGQATSLASGNLGTARSELLAALRVERIAAQEVDVIADGTRARIDLVARSLFGKLRFIEVKNGVGARLTANQQIVYPILQSAGAYFPNGILNGGAPQTIAATVIEIQHWGTRVPLVVP